MGIDAGTILRDARERAGLTQAELATRLRITQPSVARLESARANPRIRTLERTLSATGNELRLELEPTDPAVARPAIDESLVAANLARTPAERLRDFHRSYGSVRELAPTVRSVG